MFLNNILLFTVDICQRTPELTDATVTINSQNVTYHCNAGLSFPDGRVSITLPCPCRQTWEEALSGLTCEGKNEMHKTLAIN